MADARTPQGPVTPALLNRLPMFPLPRAVLFPGAVMPLHLFEPRFRALAEHCVAHERMMALATLAPGYEADYEGRPAVHPVMGVGRIVAEQRLPDGRWNIALEGIGRIELVEELAPDAPFRKIRARALDEIAGAADKVAADRLRSVVLSLAMAVPEAGRQLDRMLKTATTPGRLADGVAALFVEDDGARRALLEELEVGRRLASLDQALAKLLLSLAVAGKGESTFN